MLTHHLTVAISDPELISSETARIEVLSTIGEAIAELSLQHNALRAELTEDRFTITTAATVADTVAFSEVQSTILEALGLNPRRAFVDLICTNSH